MDEMNGEVSEERDAVFEVGVDDLYGTQGDWMMPASESCSISEAASTRQSAGICVRVDWNCQ